MSRYRSATADDIDLPKEFDDYVIARELGRGVSGRVYLAEDTFLARQVAIKFIVNTDVGARQRFLREARAVAQIAHPNVLSIYRVGMLDSRPYYVTELVRGESLDQLGKPLPWQRALDIGIGLARGLAAIHRRNVVHCDLKPSNVMIDPEGVAKIVDFGLARLVADGGGAVHIPVGTPDYMAPEVWRGESPSPRADVYSLGALLFEVVAGTTPFGDVDSTTLRQRVTTEEAPALRDRASDVDSAFAEIVARCLCRDREARFADGNELREALEHMHALRSYSLRPGENPYRGLLPFEASHRGLFFGRHLEIDAVVARLRAEPIVLVTGDSGVGKSSLCRAGVLPAVVDGALDDTWEAITVIPGPRPLTALAAALGDPDLVARVRETPAVLVRELRRRAGNRNLIVFIDQFEELVTLGDPGEVAALDTGLAALAEGVTGLRLLAAVRIDFLARISVLPGLGRDLSRLLYILRPLPPERLRDVIVGPAHAAKSRFESDDIVDDLIKATAEAGSGGLPLLSFALADLWEARDRATDVISRAAVTGMGGLAGALSRHADIVLTGMIDDRGHARRILLRLVSAMNTRAGRTAGELELDGSARLALDALVRGRLVVARDGEAGPVYELAHECLLVGWTKLRRWLEEDSTDRAARERLSQAAADWVRGGRRNDDTWQGKRLDEALALDPEALSADDRAFLVASRRAARRRRWGRGLAAFAAVGLVVLAFATQRYLAQRQLDAAVAEELQLVRSHLGDAHDAEVARTVLAIDAFTAFDHQRLDDGEQIWEKALAQAEAATGAYLNASRHAETALAKDPTRADVRNLIGDILIDRATLADRMHDIRQRDEMLGRLPLYDADNSRRARWTAPGRLIVRAAPAAAISLEPARPIGTGNADIELKPGSYVVVVATPGRVLVRAPILVERGISVTVDARSPPLARSVPTGFIYIPPGEFLYGNASEDDRRSFFLTTPQRRRSTAEYLIGRTEVTFGDWLTYVDQLPAKDRAAKLPVVEKVTGTIAVRADGAGRWRIELQPEHRRYKAGWDQPLTYPGRKRHATQDWRRFPVIGISSANAMAYARWLSDSGRLPGARLCTEVEWERAARGADGRPYPGGPKLPADDANFDITHGPGMVGPDEVGSHLGSTSPFGLFDMCGNAFELTLSEREGFVLRGGSYALDRKTAHLTNRSEFNVATGDATVGFRLCATPPLPR